MANGYGGTGVTEEEKKDIKGDRLEQGFQTGVGAAQAGAALGATIGSVIPVVGTAAGGAIGAGLGFLAGSIFGHATFDAKAERQKIKQEKNLARAEEDARNAEAAARAQASKGSQVNVTALPPAPSSEAILASSMPVTAGGRAAMDPYRRSVMNKFGWS